MGGAEHNFQDVISSNATNRQQLTRLLRQDASALSAIRKRLSHVVVDEVQDVNPVQDQLIRMIVKDSGTLTAVGDHRQAIFAWRGGRVEIMAKLYKEFLKATDAEVLELSANFRSTSRIIAAANRWAKTIGGVTPMSSPDMSHGNKGRTDFDKSHVAALDFPDRGAETRWIAQTIKDLVKIDGQRTGAAHDRRNGNRGIAYADIAILLRSSTDARTYMLELERNGIPAIFRAGPDLFSQPEVLLFIAVMARMTQHSQAGLILFSQKPKWPYLSTEISGMDTDFRRGAIKFLRFGRRRLRKTGNGIKGISKGCDEWDGGSSACGKIRSGGIFRDAFLESRGR